MRITEKSFIRKLPKVLLHDHLDGGLRPSTVVELARDTGYTGLPTTDPGELEAWFHRGAQRGNLPEYLEGFTHTTGVMQTEEALERVAYEMMEDMHKDGVVYVETRFAPVFHTSAGLHWDEAVAAVLRGLERGSTEFGVDYGVILCAMRNMKLSLEMAELAVDFRERGVVGFDLAGEEGGFPPKKHVDAFHYIQRENFNITVHAGEAFGKESIWQAIQWCGAHRIGHATRLIEDIGAGERRPDEDRPHGGPRAVCAGQADPAGDLSDQQRRHRRRGSPSSSPVRAPLPVQVPRHTQHRRPADERHDA